MDKETFRKEEIARIATFYGASGGGDDYDPYENRDIPRGTNFLETLTHLLKASLGTGMLAMPVAFFYSGWATGIISTLIISVVCTYGIHILMRSQYKLCKRLKVPYLTYPIAVRVAFLSGPLWLTRYALAARVTVAVFLMVHQTGVCAAYILFVAENLKKLLDGYQSHSLETYIAYLIVPFLLIMSIPDMKWLVPLTLIANILMFITFGIILYHIFTDLPEFGNMEAFGDIRDFPLFFGIVLFALATIAPITTIEKNMETPRQLTAAWGVLNIGMVFITVAYVSMGFFGYWRHPHDIRASITLNLDSTKVTAKVVQGLYVCSIYISYALNGMVPVDIIWHNYLWYIIDTKHPLIWEYAIRYAIVMVTFVVAVTVPLLAEILALCGSMDMTTLELIFPAMIHMCVRWTEGGLGKYNWVIIADVGIIIIGLIGMMSGTYSSIRDIREKLTQKKNSNDSF